MRFIQLDRSNAGPRLTIRDGDHRAAPIIATLVRQSYVGEASWRALMHDWFVAHGVEGTYEVRAWDGHELLGSAADLASGKLNVEDAR